MHPARLLLLLAVAVIGATADDRPVFSNFTCSAASNYTDSSPFGKNVAALLSVLSTPPLATADNYWWFRSHTVGAPPDQVSGLAVCYADADVERCLDCINSASSYWFSDLCDHSRNVGYLSSIGCAIRYADAPFLGTADSGAGARLILRSDLWASDAAGMREARRGLLSLLAERAGGDALRFATGSQGYKDAVFGGEWQVMYGMAQCTRDLPPSECSSCLIDLLAIMYRDVSVTNSSSASVMGSSCYLMYQMNKPINFIAGMVAAVPPAAPPAEPPTGSAAAPPPAPPVGTKTTVIAALAAAAVVTLFSVGA